MKTLPLHKFGLKASPLAFGCMSLGGSWDSTPPADEHFRQAQEAVDAAIEGGINFFDHADIYTRGKAETVFGKILKDRPGLRETLILQSKCGIILDNGPLEPQRYDFSYQHIIASVQGSLERLNTDYLDILLLHRPDPLMELDEVLEAFIRLKKEGKVRFFGVSNMHQGQIQYLQAGWEDPLVVNQLQLSLKHSDFLDQGIHLNRLSAKDDIFPLGTLEYCQMAGLQIQAWGPLEQGLYTGRPLEDLPQEVLNTRNLVQELALEKNVSPEAVVLAWLLRHPAGIQPVLGTKNPQRVQACCQAPDVELSRLEWYRLYWAAKGKALP